MRWLAAGSIFVCAATICGLFIGLAGGGLSPLAAVFSLLVGLLFAVATCLTTNDKIDNEPRERYARFFFWFLAAVFAMFAFRAFLWLYYIDGDEWKIQSPNNLGDLALHIAYIKNFASGVHLWPDNPIYIASKMRYPAGIDLFGALLALVHVDLVQGFVWVGLLGSLGTFYALWRWGREFAIAGFLFNGGIAGFQFLRTFAFEDYQGDASISWKSIPLSMFVTQRGWLYAIPVGLLLLWHWREYFWPNEDRQLQDRQRPPLAFAAELALYASMPLFNVHTFLALSCVLLFFFIGGDARMRRHVGVLIASALIPATFFVWLVSDNFRAQSMIEWHPGWTRNDQAMARSSVFDFWFANFGILVPLIVALAAMCLWRAYRAKSKPKIEMIVFIALSIFALSIWRLWETGWSLGIAAFLLVSAAAITWCVYRSSSERLISDEPLPEDLTLLAAASAIIIAGLLFKFAPWEWDNLKLMVWGYFILLPLLWTHLVRAWSEPVRVGVCFALFGSGFVCLFGGLAAGKDGFGIANRGEVAGVGAGVSVLPNEARFASWPTYNHPLLLNGRKVVMGYPGHLWTQGFNDYGKTEAALRTLMLGSPQWRDIARALHVRYLFWGREEKQNYKGSRRPWEAVAPITAAGDWGAIYDLEALQPNAPRSLGEKSSAP